MAEKIKRWYEQGLWTAAMVENAVKKGIITKDQCAKITGSNCVE